LIADITSGNLLYAVLDTGNGQNLIPVPLNVFQFNNGGFALNVDANTLQSAPSFQSGQIPDTTMPDWHSQFKTFWQSNGASGTGTSTGTGSTGVQATATP
jgi:hypothetical protein